ITQLLIERLADVNARDRYEYTPLHVAANNELTASARALLLAGADVTARTRGGVSALASVVRKVPAALKALHQRLDAAVSIHDASTTMLDSAFVNDTHAVQDDVVVSLNFKPLLQFSSPGEIDYLKAFVDEGHKDILKHPLCRAFLHFKWKKVRKFYVIKLLFYLLFVSVLTACVLSSNARHFRDCKSSNETEIKTEDSYRRSSIAFWNVLHHVNESKLLNSSRSTAEINTLPQSESKNTEYDAKNVSNTTDFTGSVRIQKDSKGLNKSDTLSYDLMVILSLLASIEAVRAVYSISGYASWIEYCWHLDNVLEWLVELSVIVWIVMEALGTCVSSCKCIQDHVGVLALILAYFMLTRIVGHLPQFQAYVSMYMSVLRLFLKALAAYIFLLLGFVFAFCAAFPGIDTFSNPATGIVRVTSMMAGDILYEDTFKENIKLQITSHILFMSFVLFVTIVLMNLLVGLAVHDIQLEQQTRLVAQVERALLCERAPRLLRRWLCVSPGRYRK
ncbi:Transient receptor potential channel pyrexia, partial [Gryllus bimaculatus]